MHEINSFCHSISSHNKLFLPLAAFSHTLFLFYVWDDQEKGKFCKGWKSYKFLHWNFMFKKVLPFETYRKERKFHSHNVTWFLHLDERERPISSTSNKAEGNSKREEEKNGWVERRKDWMTLTYLDHVRIIKATQKVYNVKINKENGMCDKKMKIYLCTLHDKRWRAAVIILPWYCLFIYLSLSYFLMLVRWFVKLIFSRNDAPFIIKKSVKSCEIFVHVEFFMPKISTFKWVYKIELKFFRHLVALKIIFHSINSLNFINNIKIY